LKYNIPSKISTFLKTSFKGQNCYIVVIVFVLLHAGADPPLGMV